MGIVTGLATAVADRDPILDAALDDATALAKLLGFRRDCVTAVSVGEQVEATAKRAESAAGLAGAADAVTGLVELVRITVESGRKGKKEKEDLN